MNKYDRKVGKFEMFNKRKSMIVTLLEEWRNKTVYIEEIDASIKQDNRINIKPVILIRNRDIECNNKIIKLIKDHKDLGKWIEGSLVDKETG